MFGIRIVREYERVMLFALVEPSASEVRVS